MVMSGIVAFAEETPTTEKTPMVVYSIEIPLSKGENGEERIGVWEVMGYEEKQPLIFQGTEENPKTDFSRLSLEEIELLPDGPVKRVKVKNTSKTTEIINGLKKALLELEALYEYKPQKDGSILRRIITRKDSSSIKNIIMNYEERDDKNCILISVRDGEESILYEILAYGLIYEVSPHTNIKRVDGLTSAGLEAVFESISEDGRNDPDDGLARDVAGWTEKKPQEQTDSDIEYLKKLLLSVTKEDFKDSLAILMRIFVCFSYKFDSGKVAFITRQIRIR
jgi:hypothetical protein